MSQTKYEIQESKGYYNIQVELLQPWSNFVMKAKLPPAILEKMIKTTDEIVEDKKNFMEFTGSGQLENQYVVQLEKIESPLMNFFLGAFRNYVEQAFCQHDPINREKYLTEKWYTQIISMWINSQQNNEYFPIHYHINCSLSGIIYLKIPEYLPSRRQSEFGDMGKDALNNNNDDGTVTFVGHPSPSPDWGALTMSFQPQVGDLFIFPSSLFHFVYPFRTADGKGERRSVSFNAIFSDKFQGTGTYAHPPESHEEND
jgi:hypothetical protein